MIKNLFVVAFLFVSMDSFAKGRHSHDDLDQGPQIRYHSWCQRPELLMGYGKNGDVAVIFDCKAQKKVCRQQSTYVGSSEVVIYAQCVK